MRPYLEKPFIKIGLVEWLKVKALSSSPSTTKKKERKLRELICAHMCTLHLDPSAMGILPCLLDVVCPIVHSRVCACVLQVSCGLCGPLFLNVSWCFSQGGVFSAVVSIVI
jgi:hypothetical protein